MESIFVSSYNDYLISPLRRLGDQPNMKDDPTIHDYVKYGSSQLMWSPDGVGGYFYDFVDQCHISLSICLLVWHQYMSVLWW